VEGRGKVGRPALPTSPSLSLPPIPSGATPSAPMLANWSCHHFPAPGCIKSGKWDAPGQSCATYGAPVWSRTNTPAAIPLSYGAYPLRTWMTGSRIGTNFWPLACSLDTNAAIFACGNFLGSSVKSWSPSMYCESATKVSSGIEALA